MEEIVNKYTKSEKNVNVNYLEQKDPIINIIFYSKYKPIKKLGEGSFGKIYSSININTNEKFALKMVKKIK